MTSLLSPKNIKQGATFEEVIPTSVPIALGMDDLVGVEVQSSVVTCDAVERHLIVDIPDANSPTFTLTGDTSLWKVGDANWDIKFILPSGKVIYTETYPVKVLKHYTS